MDFARTQLGHRFFEHTLPALVRELGRLADATARLADAVGRVADASASRLEPGPGPREEAR
jgi:hypothetical protein